MCLLALACGTTATALTVTVPIPRVNIIPQPKELVEGKGSFTLTARTPLVAQGDSALTIARFFADKLNTSTGFALQATSSTAARRGAIALRIDPKLPPGLRVTAIGHVPKALTAAPAPPSAHQLPDIPHTQATPA